MKKTQDDKAEENKDIKTLPEPSETSSEGKKSSDSEGKSAKKIKTASGTLKVCMSLEFRLLFFPTTNLKNLIFIFFPGR